MQGSNLMDGIFVGHAARPFDTVNVFVEQLCMCPADHKNPLFSCKLHFRGFEKWMNWLAAIGIYLHINGI